ncbi:MAG: hypothetical protein KF694_22270 [Mesorhizobium sp.]|nr:hypothetical protein [Mesorhizobium sp.]
MASPLTRLEVATGQPMKRPRDVEGEIEEALRESPERLHERLGVKTRSEPGYLRFETLVHLIRQALRRGETGEEFFFVLNARCDAILKARLSATIPDVDQLRQDILTDLATSLVEDILTGGDVMDFFECKFNLAFRGMRIDHLDKHLLRQSKTVQLRPHDSDGDEPEFPKSTDPSYTPPAFADPETVLQLKQVLAFIRKELSLEVQRVVVLVRIFGWTQERAAAHLGVAEKTIFNRLKAADEKLASVKEDA